MAFQNFNMVFQNSEHGVSKLRTWRFTRCRARTSNDVVEGKGVGQWLLQLTPVYLYPQKKSPHGLHHLLGFFGFLHHKRLGRTLRGRALPTATSLACPAWQRVQRGAGELPGGLRRKQHDADDARPRAAAAPVRILQPCGGVGGGSAQSAGVPTPGKPAHALPRAAAPLAVRAARAAGCHRARGRARRRGVAGRAPAGGERDGRSRGRAPRRRAPGARRDAATAPARAGATRALEHWGHGIFFKMPCGKKSHVDMSTWDFFPNMSF